MIKKYNKSQILKTFILVSITLALFEKIYNKSGTSGKYSIFISILLICLSLFINCIKNNGKYLLNPRILAIIPIAIYGFCNESIRYALFFLVIILWSDFEFDDLHKYHIFLILIGALWSFLDYRTGIMRVNGFMLSPTLYSCTIVISILYLLFEKNFKKSNYIFVLLGLLLIYLTGGSSAFLCGIGLLIYKLFINIFLSQQDKQNHIHKHKKIFIQIIIFLSILIITYLLIFHLDDFLSIIQRNNRDASTSTRVNYLKLFSTQLISDIKIIFIGNGGGYTQQYIKDIIGLKSHFPLHQDILMLICEYGVIGITYLYYFFMRRLKFNWIIILLIILCSFHNLILSSAIMVLILITSNTLNKQYKCVKLWH